MRRSGPAADDAGVRSPNVDADDLHVSTDNGSVTLKDSVSSWAEHDEAIDAAWAAPGVTSVHDSKPPASPRLSGPRLLSPPRDGSSASG